MSTRGKRLHHTPPSPPWSDPVDGCEVGPAMIGSTPGQKRAGPRRLPSPEDLPDGKIVVVVVAGNRTAALGSIPAGGTRVVVGNSGGAVVAVGSTLGTGEVVEGDVRFVGPTASAVGTGSVPEVEQASGTVAVAAGKLGTAAAVAGH